MKENILFICFLMLLSTACQEQSSDLDAILLQCYDSKYQEAGYDIKSIIDEHEKSLIREGILKDGSGKSYLEVLQKITSDPNFRIEAPAFMETDPWHKVDKKTGVAVFDCELEMIESLKEKDPRWQKVFSEPESPESPDQMYQAMLETMSEEDLNSYYFRLKMFQLFDMANTKNWENRS